MLSLILAAAAAPLACDNKPVLMIVSGPTHDRARMLAYGKAIADSGLYKKLGGYYVAAGRPLEVFEGTPPANYSTIVVRFPCLANARAFWNSREYQEKIKPMRLNPAAGDYLVTVQAEVPVREDMVGKVGDHSYRAAFDPAQVEQIER
ncbi:DUF1330 domain-containing protein [Sphingomonas sp.]|jgi:uncharacterized protein (DUF1330 family)|uniref:DUF1330 domain-containing protein n=1 Tax=Sphingomonas sp. TaxID=28214 RepID=UPI002DF3F6B0|nr:DUF1330 domain-containing protein [Sphingomonas sp.]